MHFRERSWLSSIWKFAFWCVRAGSTFDVYICIYLHLYSTWCILFPCSVYPDLIFAKDKQPTNCWFQQTLFIVTDLAQMKAFDWNGWCTGWLSSQSEEINCYGTYWEFHQIRFCNIINLLRKCCPRKFNEETRMWNYLSWFKIKQIWNWNRVWLPSQGFRGQMWVSTTCLSVL